MLAGLCGFSPAQPTLQLPERQPDAPTGTEFYQFVQPLSQTDREIFVYQQIALGNVPDFLRNLKPVTTTSTISGQPHTATFYVIPDYVAIGSDDDFFRMPMSGTLAQWVADLAGCNLPTRRIVNAVYTASEIKLAPYPFNPSNYVINSIDVFWLSNEAIENQRGANPLGLLVGGIKKDVVVTPELDNRPAPARVAIYGWHQLNGQPIQSLSLVHEVSYMDYSHGIRLVDDTVIVDGSPRDITGLFSDATLWPLAGDEIAFTRTRYSVAAPPPMPPQFPLADDFPSNGRQLAFWTDRFKTHTVVPFSPTAPGGDGYVLRVLDTSGGIDTARMGTGFEKDYYVEALVYCDARPELSATGLDRVGIFLRDNGNGLFTGASSGGVQGNCYGMAWDSLDGRLWCFKTVAGVITDLNPAPVYRPGDAWRRMRIEAQGPDLRFYLDGSLILATTDTTFARGQFGIGHQEIFTDNQYIQGTYAENFRAGRITPRPDSWVYY